MPSSSPYQNNDYQAANSYRPHQLPINSIFQAITSQDKFWDEGAARVKSVYDNALGMSLTLNQNKEVRDKFMKDAEDQITKLSSMNLSDPSVQRQGIGIFQPLFQDKAIQYDNALTKAKQSIFSTAESYRNKKLSSDGRVGEGFSRTNLEDALDGFEEFNANSPRDPNHLEQLYSKLGNKAYQPYYNYSKEMQDIAKNCKGVSTQSVSMNQGYITTTTESGTEAGRLRECLNYNLSEEAKSQMGIEGRRSFKNPDNTINHQALVNTYNSRYTQRLQGLTKTDQDLLASQALYDKYFETTKDEKWKKASDFVSDQRNKNSDEITNLVDGYNRMNLGDTEYIKSNYEKLAQNIYAGNLIDGFATAFENKSAKTDIKADPFEMLKYRTLATQQGNIDLENLKFEHDKILEGLKLGKKLSKDGTRLEDINDPTNPAQTEGDIVKNGITEFKAAMDATSTQAKSVTTEFYNGHVKEQWEARGGKKEDFFNPQTGEITDAGNKYLKDANLMDDPDVKSYFQKLEPINLQKAVLNATLESVDNDSGVANLSKSWQEKINDNTTFTPVTLEDGTTLTAAEVKGALEGRQGRLQIIRGTNSTVSSSSNGIPIISGGSNFQYILDGRPLETNYQFGRGIHPLHELTMKILDGNQDVSSKITERKNELLGQALVAQEGRVFATSQNTDKQDPLRQKILVAMQGAGATGLDIEDIKIIDKSPKTGRASIQVSKPLGKGTAIPKLEDALSVLSQNIGAEASKVHKSLSDNSLVFDIVDPTLVDAAYKNNRYSYLDDKLNILANVLQNTNTKREVGERIKDKTITITSPVNKNVNFSIVPYKSSQGGILWDVNVEDAQTKTFKRLKADQDINEVISLINNSK